MKSLQLLLCLTPLACLLAQTPPASKTVPLPVPPGQAAADKSPTVTLSAETPSLSAPPAVAPDTVVLTVGEEKMTAAELDHLIDLLPEQVRNQIRSMGRRRFGDNVVQLKILDQEAHRRKLQDTQAYKDQLAFQGEQILAQVLVQDIQAHAKVDDATARAYYDEHKADYEQIKASHILIRFKGSPVPLRSGQKELTEEEALAKAQEIRKKVADGGNFAELAKAESDDVGSGANGGDLGLFGHGRMVPAFEKTAFSMTPGQISEPVKSQFGYHVIKFEKREDKTFEQARPEIDKKLPPEIVRKEVEQLKASTPVVMDPAYFGPATPPAAPPGRPRPTLGTPPPPPSPK